VQEGFHVGAPKRGWSLSVVGALVQRLGQASHAADVVTHVLAATGAPSRPDA